MAGEILVRTSTGEISRISVIAQIMPGAFPYEYLKDPSCWKPFWCSSNDGHGIQNSGQKQFSAHSPVVVKVVPHVSEDVSVKAVTTPTSSSRSYMAVCEYVDHGIWMFCRMSRNVRVRDIKALSQNYDKASSLLATRSGSIGVNTDTDSDLASVFQSWTLEPNWQITESKFTLNMKKSNLGLQTDDNPQDLFTDLPMSNSVYSNDPLNALKAKYIETLYSKTPLSYFAKSALSRIRALCRERSTDKQQYLALFFKLLKRIVVEIPTIDTKFISGNVPEEETAYFEKITASTSPMSEARKAILDGLKLREIQLQVIVLLELIAISNSDENALKVDTVGTTSSELKPNTPEEPKMPKTVVPKPARLSLIRNRRSKPVRVNTSATAPSPPVQLPFKVHVELLFDRLCIIQALEDSQALEEPMSLNEQQQTSLQHRSRAPKQDKILEFCIEVILPYYGNRLPELTKSLVRKIKGMVTKWTSSSSSSSNLTLTSKYDQSKNTGVSPIFPISPPTDPSKLTEASTKYLTLSPAVPATRTKSKTLLNNQKRQVEVVSLKAIRKDSLDSELANAIRTISRPNRSAALEPINRTMGHPKRRVVGLGNSNIQQELKPKVNVQVNATPVKKKRPLSLQPYNHATESSSTPSKRSRHDFIISSPTQQTDEDIE